MVLLTENQQLYYSESMVLIKFSVPIIALYSFAKIFAYMCQMLAENHVPELYNLVHSFGQISFHTQNSSLEGATMLNFAPFCSS